MKVVVLLAFVLTLTGATPAPASTKIKIDTIPAEYRPHTGAERILPVSMQDFYFEINKETGRARVVVEYTIPHQVDYQSQGDLGVPPTSAQLPGLTYDPGAHAVVYSGDGKRTVCALVPKTKDRRATLRAKRTGSCVVTTSVGEHTQDDGFSLHRSRALDVYFEVH